MMESETVAGRSRGHTYRVQNLDGCTLIHGAVPMDQMAALCGLSGKDAVVAFDLASLSGATMAFGPQPAVDALVSKLRAEKLAEPRSKGYLSGLSDGAQAWYLAGEHGLSSVTIFVRVTGIRHPYIRNNRTEPNCYPHDPADLRRCRLLLEASPEVRARFKDVMPGVSPTWRALVDVWDDLCKAMDAECPEWRDGRGGRAIQTYEKIQSAIRSVQS